MKSYALDQIPLRDFLDFDVKEYNIVEASKVVQILVPWTCTCDLAVTRAVDFTRDPDGMALAADRRRKAKALEEAGAALSVKLNVRSTRGQRVTELQGDDAEADETFWGQRAWQAEDGDSEFSSEEGWFLGLRPKIDEDYLMF